MGWKNIRTAQQLNLFGEESPKKIEDSTSFEKVVEPPKRSRSDYFFLQPYPAKGSSSCSTHPSECHQGGRVESGDSMIAAIGMPRTIAAGQRHYFHDGPCSKVGIERIDNEARRAERS